DTNGMPYKNEYDPLFTTDGKGQIWIAPQFLGKGTITISDVEWDATKLKQGDMSKKEFNYYEGIYNVSQLFEADQLAGSTIVVDGMYNVAGATGDMTVVYVMVAAAAVITLGAVVIMKKKAVKAN
ncbi:MAG: hypothetical protein J6W14_04815, partial [Clostridia bacterium]|nr:hypothetical protein [Clostridia bacterium]